MTSGLQPINSGAPTPVQGVTGGPPVLGGQISNDPQTGNVVVAPNPGQVLQVRKGSNPTALQVYEYFHTNTDYSRIALNSQTGGPFQLQVETAPSTVVRDLDINANGNIPIVAGGNASINSLSGATIAANANGNVYINGGAGGSLIVSIPIQGNAATFSGAVQANALAVNTNLTVGVDIHATGIVYGAGITSTGTGTAGDIYSNGRLVTNYLAASGAIYFSGDIAPGHTPNLGSAPALPAAPGGYFHWFIGGIPILVPFYNTAT